MFARTFSFWRRLTGHTATAGNPPETDDRRLWIRYPANLQTLVQSADAEVEDRASAKIRDISRGGANLLLDKSFTPGEMISMELPCATSPDHVFQLLACVVRSQQEPDGRFALGCVFSRELSEEDLCALGASRVRHAPEDNRVWMRFPCQLKANFHKIGETEDLRHAAEITDISASGVGIDVKELIEIGSLLNLHVIGKLGQEHTMLACVVHSTHSAERAWSLGCNFIRELSERDFQQML